MERFFNVSLRGAGLGLRFVLVIVVAKLLEPNDLGVYGLLAAVASYTVILVGLEFYSFSVRELAGEPSRCGYILYNQLCLYIPLYALLAPLLFFFLKDRLNLLFCILFILIVISEHLAQEFNRVLNALGRQLFASLVLFCRMGLWVIFCICYLWLVPSSRNLETVLAFWFFGNIFSLVLAAILVWGYISFSALDFDARWVAKGLKVSLNFMLGMVFLRAIFVLDKVFIERIAGQEFLGVYAYYFGGAMAIASIVDAAIYTFAVPSLIAKYKEGGRGFANLAILMMRKGMFFSALVSLVAMMFYYIANIYLDHDIYSENFHVGVMLFLAMFMYSSSVAFNNVLYVAGKELSLMVVNFAVFVVFLALCWGFSAYNGYAISLVVAFSMLLLLMVKACLSFRVLKEGNTL